MVPLESSTELNTQRQEVFLWTFPQKSGCSGSHAASAIAEHEEYERDQLLQPLAAVSRKVAWSRSIKKNIIDPPCVVKPADLAVKQTQKRN